MGQKAGHGRARAKQSCTVCTVLYCTVHTRLRNVTGQCCTHFVFSTVPVPVQ